MNSKNSKGILENYIKKYPKRLYWLLAFLLTFIIYTLAFSVNGMLSNGLRTNVRSDLVHQMIPYAQYFMRVLKGQHSFWFSWSNSLGQGMAGTFAYYALSPFNLLFLLFDSDNVLRAISLIIILKASFSSLIMQIFLEKLYRRRCFSTVIFAVLYSLCGYQISYYFLTNFTDAVYLLPLIMMGVLRLIKYKRLDLLIAAYTVTFIMNLYFGYILGICSFILFVLYLIYQSGNIRNKMPYEMAKREISIIIVKYVYGVITSLMISAVVWLPAAYQMLGNRADDSELLSIISSNPIWIFNNLFVGQLQTLNGYIPFVYCGIISIFMMPLYISNKKINARKRLFFGLAILIFVLFMCIEPLNHFMHVFDNPQMFAYRYSFVLSFILSVMGCGQWFYLKNSGIRKIILIGVVSSIIYILSSFLFRLQLTSNTWINGSINIVIIALWIGIFYLIIKKRVNIISAILLLIMMIGIEEIVNISICFSNMEHDSYNQDLYEAYGEIDYNTIYLNDCFNMDNEKFGRVLSMGGRQYNYSIANDFAGVSFFNSVDNEKLQDVLSDLGFRRLQHSIEGYGSTPVTQALFDIKYITNIDVEKIGDSYINLKDMYNDNPDLLYANNGMGIGILPVYRNDRLLSLGYMVSDSIKDVKFVKSSLENQNILLSAMLGEEVQVFDKTEARLTMEAGDSYIYERGNDPEVDRKLGFSDSDRFYVLKHADGKHDSRAIFHYIVRNGDKPVYFEFEHSRDDISNTYMFSRDRSEAQYWGNTIHWFSKPCIFPMGLNDDNDYELTLVLPEDVYSDFYEEMDVAEFDEAKFGNITDRLAEHELEIDAVSDGYVNGSIDAGAGGVMFTSIPYDRGWNVYVDGTKTQTYRLVDDAFLGFDLSAGEHNIEMKYVAPGMYAGIIVSIIGLMLTTLYSLLYVYSSRKAFY